MERIEYTVVAQGKGTDFCYVIRKTTYIEDGGYHITGLAYIRASALGEEEAKRVADILCDCAKEKNI